MRYKLVLVDREEQNTGEKEEAGEHHLTPDDAESVAAQHLTKHPHYYTDLEKAGLNEKIETGPHFPFSDKKVVGKGRLGRKMKHPSTTVGSSLPVSGPR